MNEEFTWWHCDHLLAKTFSLNELLKIIDKSIYVKPIKEKMVTSLKTETKYSYGMGVFKVERRIVD